MEDDEESKDDDAEAQTRPQGRVVLPRLEQGEPLDNHGIEPKQHFTEPPPRYTEATLIKALEKENIGRPSTYAPIIQTIQDRLYVEQKERRFNATELGFGAEAAPAGSALIVVIATSAEAAARAPAAMSARLERANRCPIMNSPLIIPRLRESISCGKLPPSYRSVTVTIAQWPPAPNMTTVPSFSGLLVSPWSSIS